MEIDRHLPELTESFSPVATEARPGNRMLDLFDDRFTFEPCPTDDKSADAVHVGLNQVLHEAQDQETMVYCAVDASVPNDVQRQAVSTALLVKWSECGTS